MRVGVVGAGAAGLACAEVFARRGLEVVVLEAWRAVGGTWCTEKPGTALYDGLRTNLPTKLMAFPGFPFPEGLSSFVGSKEMDEYLVAFAKEKDLLRHVTLNASVDSITTRAGGGFLVSAEISGVPRTMGFDAVVIANGHFNKPRIPAPLLEDVQQWQGRAIHSKFYRVPEEFAGQVVVVVGAASSGTDIARELDGVARQVHVCDEQCPVVEAGKQGMPVPGTSCVVWRPRLEGLPANSKRVDFKGGSSLDGVDTVIFCTGYQFSYSDFLGPNVIELPHQGKRVRPVYREMLHVGIPNLFFIGLNQPIVPFPFFHIQAEWIASMVLKPSLLPSSKAQWDEVAAMDERIASGTITPNMAHVLPDQWEYMLSLAREAELPDLDHLQQTFDKARAIYKAVGAMRPKLPGQDDAYRRAQI